MYADQCRARVAKDGGWGMGLIRKMTFFEAFEIALVAEALANSERRNVPGCC